MAVIRSRKTAAGVRRWQWQVRRKGHSPISGTCPTKACAIDCAAKAEADMLAGRLRGLTVAELLDRFERLHLPSIPDSAPMYARHLAWWRRELGDADAQTIPPARIAAARERLKVEPRRGGKTLSPPSVNRYLQTLSSAFRWGSLPEIGLVDRNPVRDVSRGPERKRVRFLSRPIDEADSELERLMAALPGSTSPTLPDLVVLLLRTGCRESEWLEAEVSWVRIPERGMAIPEGAAKTEEARFVALDNVAFAIVQRRYERARLRGDRYLFPGIKKGTHAAFPRDAWERLMRRARISGFVPHDLRHTHASYLLMMGKSLMEVGLSLGHKSAQSTLRYAHLASQHQRQVASDLGAQLDQWITPLPRAGS